MNIENLNPDLLLTEELQEFDLASYSNKAKPLGTYNPMQFVIRLKDTIHKAMRQDDASSERMQAFSTFMHENIHWWQHVGSNIGFIRSLSYPVIAHLSHDYLKNLIKNGEKYKSIMDYDEHYHTIHNSYSNEEVNKILNTWYDPNSVNVV